MLTAGIAIVKVDERLGKGITVTYKSTKNNLNVEIEFIRREMEPNASRTAWY